MRKTFLMGAACMVAVLYGSAQDSANVTTLREVVVSASRTQQPLIDIPRSITVISSEVIETSVYQSLGDLLNAESGLYVTGATQTPGTNQNVFMRGANSNQVAVLIDGVRVTDPSSPNSAIDLSEISLTNVDRIEIIRGSHSTMYGGAAVGGVINIITKAKPDQRFHGLVSTQAGTFGKGTASFRENASISYGMNNGLYISGSVFQENAKGLDASEKTQTFPSFTSDRDDFWKTDGTLKAGFSNGGWDAFVLFKNVHQHTEIDNGAFADDDNNYLLFDRRFIEYRLARKLTSSWKATVIGSFSGSERFYENDSSKINATTYDKTYSTGTYHGRLQTHELQFNYEKKKMKGVFGAGVYGEKMFFDNYFFFKDPAFVFESVTNYDTINTRTDTRYLFGQITYQPGRFQVSGGTRLSRHSTAGNFMTVEINPSLSFGDLLIFGSASTGFNAPSLYQLYDPSRGFTSFTTRGNPRLKPETSLSLETGIKKEFPFGNFVTLSAYQTAVRHSIEYVYLWDASTPVDDLGYNDDRGDTYINAGESLVRGVEMEGFVRINAHFLLRGNMSAISSHVTVRGEDIDIRQTGGNHIQLYNLGVFLGDDIEQRHLVRRPDFTGYLNLSYRPLSAITVHTAYRYTGKRLDSGYDAGLGPYGALSRIQVDAYHLVDAGIDWQASKVYFVAFSVENLLNERYRELVGFQTRGRSAYLKVSARW
ncbi:MAG TPA: TonB-dependent receptor [Chryseosolibacter sp.]